MTEKTVRIMKKVCGPNPFPKITKLIQFFCSYLAKVVPKVKPIPGSIAALHKPLWDATPHCLGLLMCVFLSFSAVNVVCY